MRGRKVKLGAYVALAALAMSLIAPAAAEETFEERYAKFSLFDDCRSLKVVVEHLHSDATEIGLTEGEIQSAAKRRLRSARLYDPNAHHYLYVRVNVFGRAAGIEIHFKKRVVDVVSAITMNAVTWDAFSMAIHDDDASYVLSVISKGLDLFLHEYLRVNEEACEKR